MPNRLLTFLYLEVSEFFTLDVELQQIRLEFFDRSQPQISRSFTDLILDFMT